MLVYAGVFVNSNTPQSGARYEDTGNFQICLSPRSPVVLRLSQILCGYYFCLRSSRQNRESVDRLPFIFKNAVDVARKLCASILVSINYYVFHLNVFVILTVH